MSLRRIFFAMLSITLLGASSISADTYTKREMRSVWLTTVYAIDWPSTQGTSASAQASQKEEMDGYNINEEVIKYIDERINNYAR